MWLQGQLKYYQIIPIWQAFKGTIKSKVLILNHFWVHKEGGPQSPHHLGCPYFPNEIKTPDLLNVGLRDMVCLKTNPTIFFNFIVILNHAQGTWFQMSVVLLYPRVCDFIVVRTFAQSLANSRFYSEFTSFQPRYLYRIRDPGLEGELTRGFFKYIVLI